MTTRAKRDGEKRLEVRREISAGGLIWRRRQDKRGLEVVLVRPAGKDTWVLPKGHVERGEGVLDAALREAAEESGLKVVAGEPLGVVSYVYAWRDRPDAPLTRIFKRVHFYLMECSGGDPSAHDREIDEVAWLELDEALKRASHKSERDLIAKARAVLQD
jgi:ADP-ribose pyrophosphatase YjhB (NUDIX family)